VICFIYRKLKAAAGFFTIFSPSVENWRELTEFIVAFVESLQDSLY
jgi:hypothetical protein